MNIKTLVRRVLRRTTRDGGTSSSMPRYPEPGHPEPGPLLDEIRTTAARLRRLLEVNIIPFWTSGIVDVEHGGYRLNHDVAGRWLGPDSKHLVTQARTIWFYARLIRAGYDHEFLAGARAGVSFLRERMWDPQRGGFYWIVDDSGREVVYREQRAYGQVFALYALSEFARASSCAESRELADRTFALLEERFHDSQHGGYFAIDPHTTTEPPSVAMEKWQNDHVHALEALVAYFAIAPSPLVRERIVETILILSRTVVRSDHASSRDRHSRAWHPDPADRRVSYGHDVECGWLLLDACDAIGMSPSLLLPHVTAIFGTLLAHGLDRGGGGVCHTGNVGASADDRRRIWWVQAEVLVGSLDLYMRTGLPAAGRVYLEVLQWIDSKQADWTNGEWHDCITASGMPEGKKAAHWKGPYHSGRAMIECLLRVERLSAA